MVERIYISLWGIYFLAVGLFYLGGLFTAGTVLVFGFILFGLLFMGLIGVLPFWATHHLDTKQ